MGYQSRAGRLFRRLSRRGCGAPDARRNRQRYGRLNPPAGGIDGHHWHQTYLWPRLALLLSALADFDARDSTSLARAPEDFTRKLGCAWLEEAPSAENQPGRPLHGLRIGLPKEYCVSGLAADVQRALDAALNTYQT